MVNHCDECPYYFDLLNVCPIVPFSQAGEQPWEFLISFVMVLASTNVLFNFASVFYTTTNWINKIHLLPIYAVPLLLSELVLKFVLNQPRPDGACADTPGMPSGHAVASGLIFAIVCVLQMTKLIPKTYAFLYISIAVLQAYSRIHLGYHDYLQVFVGFSLGTSSALILMMFFPIYPKKDELNTKEEKLVVDQDYLYQIAMANQSPASQMV
ncbi:unnamed protein product [Moneuplotes crassus]|uniref:Phosphatidic acid phosphatase type 2/haloperoxidase domain-containing protein n=1 Tax=Euplotes crassus TaxID=5936 RepID=A0AAD1XX53_EUPCR|nr:unnamed protein product [Moneuplotes crassus]